MIKYDYKKCPVCGIHYAVDADVMRYKSSKSSGQESWYCPNGHNLIFKETAIDFLTRQLNNANQQIARAEQEAAEALRQAEVARKSEARIKKRIHGGTCPCCKRHFVNVERHMKTKHADGMWRN